jgi:aryl-alcohol dehydrogenase-like predicted oxidoreductase
LEILDRITEIARPAKGSDWDAALNAIRNKFPTVADFEREFPSIFCPRDRRRENAEEWYSISSERRIPMADNFDNVFSRRQFIRSAALTSAGLSIGPYFTFGKTQPAKLVKRQMGRLGFEATTLGLGGQASLQWTPADVDPVKIILKAFDLGVNYFDTSNLYDSSQLNYGKAFRELHLIPGQPGYNERLRRSIFLTSKTALRFGKGGWQKQGLINVTNGAAGSHTADDIKRTLSQIFGDGQGSYPEGAYLNMVLMHSIGHNSGMADVDSVYEGYEHPDPKAETIGALATLIDYRDGTNLTGLNPKQEKLIRHIGFSGHAQPDVMMEMIQRDSRGVLDGMLVAINANDRMNFNMQHNIIPVAAANNLGIIAMKVFADGAMYDKAATWTSKPDMVVRRVGSATLPSRRLVEYSLTTPGVHTAIIGTGHIDGDYASCQMQQNLSAAQIAPNGLSISDRREIEKLAGTIKEGKTNYFQAPAQALGAARTPTVAQETRGQKRVAQIKWQTAYAGNEPIIRYEILRDGQKAGQVMHKPQITRTPFLFEDALSDKTAHSYQIVTVDTVGRTAKTEDVPLSAV